MTPEQELHWGTGRHGGPVIRFEADPATTHAVVDAQSIHFDPGTWAGIARLRLEDEALVIHPLSEEGRRALEGIVSGRHASGERMLEHRLPHDALRSLHASARHLGERQAIDQATTTAVIALDAAHQDRDPIWKYAGRVPGGVLMCVEARWAAVTAWAERVARRRSIEPHSTAPAIALDPDTEPSPSR